ncbi:MAG: hypothetical protein ACON5F_02240 [Jejuia sp.]
MSPKLKRIKQELDILKESMNNYTKEEFDFLLEQIQNELIVYFNSIDK